MRLAGMKNPMYRQTRHVPLTERDRVSGSRATSEIGCMIVRLPMTSAGSARRTCAEAPNWSSCETFARFRNLHACLQLLRIL